MVWVTLRVLNEPACEPDDTFDSPTWLMVATLLVDDWLLLTELAAPFWVTVATVFVPPVWEATARLPRPLFWVWVMVMVSLAEVLSWLRSGGNDGGAEN